MINKNEMKKVSKSLSYVLRHRPDTIGIELDESGWVSVEDLLNGFRRAGKRYSIEMLQQVVATNDKKRFEFSEDGQSIRARQGHSVQVDLGYVELSPPDVLYHGTATRFLESIREKGLLKMNRHHVHLSTNRQTMVAVGKRHGVPVIIQVDAKAMLEAEHKFYKTDNEVWLTDHVPVEYLMVLDEMVP